MIIIFNIISKILISIILIFNNKINIFKLYRTEGGPQKGGPVFVLHQRKQISAPEIPEPANHEFLRAIKTV